MAGEKISKSGDKLINTRSLQMIFKWVSPTISITRANQMIDSGGLHPSRYDPNFSLNGNSVVHTHGQRALPEGTWSLGLHCVGGNMVRLDSDDPMVLALRLQRSADSLRTWTLDSERPELPNIFRKTTE